MSENTEDSVLSSANELFDLTTDAFNNALEALKNPLQSTAVVVGSIELLLDLYETKMQSSVFQAALGNTGVFNLGASIGLLGMAVSEYREGKQGAIVDIYAGVSGLTQAFGSLMVAYGGVIVSDGGAAASTGASIVKVGRAFGAGGMAFSAGLLASRFLPDQTAIARKMGSESIFNSFLN
jgi:hypothetical protein